MSITPRFQATPPGGPAVTLSKVRGVLVGTNGDSIVVEALFQGDAAVLVFTVQFPGNSARYTLKLTGFDKDNVERFAATQEYTVKAGDNPGLPAPELVYSAPDSKVANLKVNPGSLSLDAGASASLSAVGTTAGGTVVSPVLLGWSSKDAGVASVDANGVVRAGQFQGSTYIVARTYTGIADSVLVRVKAPVAKVVVAPTSLELIRGKSGAAGAELRDAGNHLIDDRTPSWSSSDPSVATVNASGVIQGLRIGTATITASAEGKTADVAVRVVSPLDHIELTPSSLSFASLGEKGAIAAKLVPRAGGSVDGITATFASSNPGVASVDASGAVTANQNGGATITATADGLTATASVTVRQVAATISVSPKSAVATALGDTRTFSATVADALGNAIAGASVAWSSSNGAVASVSNGVAVARGAGTAIITASIDGKSDAASFNVSQIPRLLFASVGTAPIQVGQTTTLQARVADANGAIIGPVRASWSTSTPSLVTVTDSTVTGIAAGAAKLTATASGLTAQLNLQVNAVPGSSLVVTPASVEKLPGGTQQFSVSGGTANSWTVNGIPNGNSTFGTISATGFYTAPAAVPNPATFNVCAVQASPSATGCASVTINAIPTAGGEVVVFNDMNLFDNSNGVSTGGANQIRFFRNLASFTGTGARASKTGFMFFRGHNSICLADFECSVSSNSMMADSLRTAGFTVVDVNDASATIPSTIDPNVKVILLLNPAVPFSTAEINSLKRFAGEGGRIVFAGEHGGFYGSYISTVENAFFSAMGAQLTNLSTIVNCSFGSWVVPPSSLRAHQITTGLTGLSIPCASEIQLGPNDFPIVYDVTGTHIVGAVAKVDLTPITVTNATRPSVGGRTSTTSAGLPPLPPVDGTNRPRP